MIGFKIIHGGWDQAYDPHLFFFPQWAVSLNTLWSLGFGESSTHLLMKCCCSRFFWGLWVVLNLKRCRVRIRCADYGSVCPLENVAGKAPRKNFNHSGCPDWQRNPHLQWEIIHWGLCSLKQPNHRLRLSSSSILSIMSCSRSLAATKTSIFRCDVSSSQQKAKQQVCFC